LIRHAKDVRVVLGETAHTQQTVQHARTLVAIHGAQLGQPYGKLPVAAQLRLVNQDVSRAIHGLELVIGFFNFDGAEHIFAIKIRVAAGLPQFQQHDMWGENEIVAAASEFVAQPVFHFAADDAALGMPENQARAGFFLNAEKIEFLAQLAVIAALGFFELVEIFVEVFLLHETSAVNPLHLRIAFLALPVRAGHVHQLECLDAAGGGNMGPAAEIQKFPGGVKRHHRLAGFFFHQLAFEFLVAFAIELERFRLRNHLALVGNIFRG
jgi:hypothetical protein